MSVPKTKLMQNIAKGFAFGTGGAHIKEESFNEASHDMISSDDEDESGEVSDSVFEETKAAVVKRIEAGFGMGLANNNLR